MAFRLIKVKIKANPCSNAKGMVIILVSRSNFLLPFTPPFAQRVNTGTKSVDNNCTIIEAVI